MKTRLITALILLLTLSQGSVFAQRKVKTSDAIRPVWVKGHYPGAPAGSSYHFTVVEDMGTSLPGLMNNRSSNLANYIQSSQRIEGIQSRDITSLNGNSQNLYTISFATHSSTSTFQCEMIDNYWESIHIPGEGLQYRLYTCYAISDPGAPNVNFDKFQLKTGYGARGIWRSALVPGWGQMYKGSYLKGGFMMGGIAALVAGIIVTENTRSDYVRLSYNTHDASLVRSYTSKANHFATARNICIGAAAALWVWSFIDAWVAPGARYIAITPSGIGYTRNF